MKGCRASYLSFLYSLAGFLLFALPVATIDLVPSAAAQAPVSLQPNPGLECLPDNAGSPYFTVDSWIYPAVMRLYSLGFVDHVFLNIRPWTRITVARLLEDANDRISDAGPGSVT